MRSVGIIPGYVGFATGVSALDNEKRVMYVLMRPKKSAPFHLVAINLADAQVISSTQLYSTGCPWSLEVLNTY